jgi:SAM-dependent methyltransferase
VAEQRTARAALGAIVERRIALFAPARRLRLALAMKSLEDEARGRPLRVLDAGCGDGLLTIGIARRHPDWSLVGLDLRDELLEYARVRALEQRLTNVRFERADLNEPLGEDGFDGVLSIETLEEIPDDERALRVMAAAVAPGGMLIAHVPERSWRPILPGSAPAWRDEVRHGYTAAAISTMLERAGLAVIEVRPTYRGTVAIAQEIRDRLKSKPLAVRALAFPAMAGAVSLERLGLTWGPPHALLATARRPPTPIR